ncbi:MAG: hypothetical protein D6725_06365, partial [Planctomycetota bacterium]
CRGHRPTADRPRAPGTDTDGPLRLAERLRRRATDLLAIGIVAAVTLTLGRWLARGPSLGLQFWHDEPRIAFSRDPRPAAGNPAVDRNGPPPTGPSTPEPSPSPQRATAAGRGTEKPARRDRALGQPEWSIRVGPRGAWSVRRRTMAAAWEAVRSALVAESRTFLQSRRTLFAASPDGPTPAPLPEPLARRAPLQHGDGRWRIDVVTGGPPVVLGSLADEAAAPRRWRVVWWSIAIPRATEAFDVYTCRFAPPDTRNPGPTASPMDTDSTGSAGPHELEDTQPLHAVLANPPPNGRLLLCVGTSGPLPCAVYVGQGTVGEWTDHFDRVLTDRRNACRADQPPNRAQAFEGWQRLSDGSFAKTFRCGEKPETTTGITGRRPAAQDTLRVVVRSTAGGASQALIMAPRPEP